MADRFSPRVRAILEALFVTFLWSTSWVLIKLGLRDIPALVFAGLRYTLAFLCLLPFALRSGALRPLRRASTGTWARLITLGTLFYAVTSGAQFVSLYYLPAVTTGLLLSFTTVLVALGSVFLLREQPTALQWGGALIFLAGVLVYFYPLNFEGESVGLAVAGVGVLANALSSVLGRRVNRDEELSPLAVTVASMGVGAVVLLAAGVAVQGMVRLSPIGWGIVLWLAVVNSALAYTLWNKTLQTLTAVESSIINNTMLFQVGVLAWAFLGERPTWLQVGGMVLAVAGTVAAQVRVPHRASHSH